MKSPEELSEIIEQMSELCIRNKCTYPEMIRLVFPFLAWIMHDDTRERKVLVLEELKRFILALHETPYPGGKIH